MVLRVTNIPDNVTWGVARDIQTMTVLKTAHLDSLDWAVKTVVANNV